MDIGQLTGAVSIEDQFSSVLEVIEHRVEHFAESFEGALGGIAVGVGAAVTVLAGMTAAVTALAVKGSDVNDVAATFEHFTARVDGAEASLAALRDGTRETVSDMVLMKDANKLLSVGVKLTTDDFKLLGDAAFVLQNRGLGGTADMLEMVSQAMVTGRTRTLAMKLGVVDAADASQAYADKLGILRSELTVTQQAEAKRITIMEMLRSAVQDAGVQQLDFGEKVEQVRTRIENWVEALESTIAKSPAVARAFDTIIASVEKFVDSSDLMENIVAGVEHFADAVTNYGPMIINTLIGIKNWISAIWTAVTDAWDTVPDWLKEIGKAAIVASLGIYAVDKVMGSFQFNALGAAGASKDFLGTASNYGTITDASISVGKLAANLGVARTAIQNVAEHWGLMNPIIFEGVAPLATLAGKLALWATVATTAYEVGKVLSLMWVNHKEETERAAAAVRQSAFDNSNLIILNEKLGTSFTDVNAASAEWIKRNKEATPEVAAHAAALKEQDGRLRAYEASVHAVMDSVKKSQSDLNVDRDAYERLGNSVMFTVEAQRMFIAAMDKMIDSGRQLTKTEADKYQMIVQDRLATLDLGEASLKHQGITIEMIESAKALGLTESELAEKWKVSTGAVQAYATEMKTLQALEREIADLEMETSGHTADIVIAQREREYKDAVAKFRGTAEEYIRYRDLMAKKRDDEALRDHMSSAMSISDRIAEANSAQREYVRMVESGNYFRSDLDAQRSLVYQLQDALHNMGAEGVAAENAITDSAHQATVAIRGQSAAAQEAAAQAKIRKGFYTIGPDGKAVAATGDFSSDYTGKSTEMKGADVTNTALIQRMIDQITVSLASWKGVPEGFKGLIDAGGGGTFALNIATQNQRAAVQAHEDQIAQLAYLKTLIGATENVYQTVERSAPRIGNAVVQGISAGKALSAGTLGGEASGHVKTPWGETLMSSNSGVTQVNNFYGVVDPDKIATMVGDAFQRRFGFQRPVNRF